MSTTGLGTPPQEAQDPQAAHKWEEAYVAKSTPGCMGAAPMQMIEDTKTTRLHLRQIRISAPQFGIVATKKNQIGT